MTFYEYSDRHKQELAVNHDGEEEEHTSSAENNGKKGKKDEQRLVAGNHSHEASQ